ncbi:TetR/AcrR family transcriptional regulator [Rhodococcus sp. ARC_M6]|uniref:TetR/AcrR family transcriptional regulator n=1 Tax=Rhodococcus sp. ARC_M6 TaxID=2928852 RepID=UPI001FB22BC3|nr:TetR/AcrR family transcriptional regulator [Rhodococcus sp. ARC_M6]MCJ0901956.1 TetR/AcrR family transcriptional regulator [Rhodococcus sp. ARC_M6]
MPTTHPDAPRAGISADCTPPRLRADAKANLERILYSARAVFGAQGLDATLADVARHAGVGVGTVYRRFASKDELIQALFDTRCAEIESLATISLEAPDAWAGLVHYLEEISLRMSDNRGFGDLLMDSRFESDAFSKARASITRSTAALVNRAKAQGTLRSDFEINDVPLLMQTIKMAQNFGGDEAPQAYRRVLGFMIDGLCSSRSAPRELPVPALTTDQLDHVLHRCRSASDGGC